MKSRKRYLLVIALVIASMFTSAYPGQRSSAQSGDRAALRRIAEDFANALLVARDNYAGPIDFSKVTKASIVGMLRTVSPQSSYYDSKEWAAVQGDPQASGIGSTIVHRNHKVYIISPFEGSQAHQAGLRYGDQIVEINGESIVGWSFQQVSNKLLGLKGTPLTVKVTRLSVGQPVEFKLVREAVRPPSVSNYFMTGVGIGYINLDRGFNFTSYDEIRAALTDLQKQGLTSLILDLRDNSGGLVDQAKRITNLFLYRGQPIVTMKGRPQVFPTREEAASNTNPEEFPVVVLINSKSAAASEIVAGALQDNHRAVVVGETSLGRGVVQSLFQFKDGSALSLVTGRFYMPGGRVVQREYRDRSFYDNYLNGGDKGGVQQTEQKQTLGRGGIEPDVIVKFRSRELELQRVWLDSVFHFTRALVAGQVGGLTEFKIDGPCDHKHRLAGRDYPTGDKVHAAFKNFLREHKELGADESRIDKDADWLKRRIRYETATAAYCEGNARAALADGDAQLQRAIAELPRAKALADEIRRKRSR